MDLPEPDPGDKWFLDWVLASPVQAGRHLIASYYALFSIRSALPGNAWRIREYFGGIGAHSMIAESLFQPRDHVVTELSPTAVSHLRQVLPSSTRVHQADAYVPGAPGDDANLVIMDFGDMTAFKAQKGQQQGDLLERVIAESPLAVTITDIAGRYLHLQRNCYEGILGAGTCDTYEDYLEAFAHDILLRFGYRMISGYWTHWSAVMAFTREDPYEEPGPLIELPLNRRDGLVISR